VAALREPGPADCIDAPVDSVEASCLHSVVDPVLAQTKRE
jgi:hypothetical protein